MRSGFTGGRGTRSARSVSFRFGTLPRRRVNWQVSRTSAGNQREQTRQMGLLCSAANHRFFSRYLHRRFLRLHATGMALEGQQSLFGFPADVDRTPVRRKARATNRRPVSIQCQGCGHYFSSYVRGVRCDDCRKERKAARPPETYRTGRVSEYGYIEEFPPGY